MEASESFDGAKLGKDWAAAKGTWKISDGVLSGAEKVSGRHADFAAEKPNYRFVMRGEHLRLDDLKVWEVKS